MPLVAARLAVGLALRPQFVRRAACRAGPPGWEPNSHLPSSTAPQGPATHRNHSPFALWLPIAEISQMTNSTRLTEAQDPQAVRQAGDSLPCSPPAATGCWEGACAIRRMDSSGRW
jgi:hypothetical protein